MNAPRTDSIKSEVIDWPDRNLNSPLRRLVDEHGYDAVNFELSVIKKEIDRNSNELHEFKANYAMGYCEICEKMEDQGNHLR